MKNISYYEILGISKKATKDEIKDAYHKLAFKYHPDRNKDPAAEEKFKKINEAYETLGNSNKKYFYDLDLNASISYPEDQKPNRSTSSKSEASFFSKFKDNFGLIFFLILTILVFLSIFQYFQINKSINQNSTTLIPTVAPTETISPDSTEDNTDNSDSQLSPTPTPSDPMIDCVGPDGKHLNLTQKECDDFNNVWKPTPTATPTPTDSSSGCSSCPSNSYCYNDACHCYSGFSKNSSTGQCDPCPKNSTSSDGVCTCNTGYSLNSSTGQCDPQ